MSQQLYNDPVTWKYGTESDYNRTRRHEPNEVFFVHDSDAGNKVYKGTELFTKIDTFRLTRPQYDELRRNNRIEKDGLYIVVDENDELKSVHIGTVKIKDWNGEPFRMPFRF